MQIVKKYANRKLYHTNRKRYITLEGVAEIVQSGQQVQVLDNESGEDITAHILAQVVSQSGGNKGKTLPSQVLTNLIRLGGNTLANVQRAVFASLGGKDLIEAEITRRLDILASEGTIDEQEYARWRNILLRRDFGPTTLLELPVQIPSRSDILSLHGQIDALMDQVELLIEQQTHTSKDKQQ
jgi:polyhydroxyalkanoate synthesis repressor PhaR